jgi:hypothetical protein
MMRLLRSSQANSRTVQVVVRRRNQEWGLEAAAEQVKDMSLELVLAELARTHCLAEAVVVEQDWVMSVRCYMMKTHSCPVDRRMILVLQGRPAAVQVSDRAESPTAVHLCTTKTRSDPVHSPCRRNRAGRGLDTGLSAHYCYKFQRHPVGTL